MFEPLLLKGLLEPMGNEELRTSVSGLVEHSGCATLTESMQADGCDDSVRSEPKPGQEQETFIQELRLWRAKVQVSIPLVVVEGVTTPCKHQRHFYKYIYDSGLYKVFPNIYILYQIFCTIPATSASAERSFSKLAIIENYRRLSMGLSNLALISLERQTASSCDFELTIKRFAEMKTRRMMIL